MARHPVAAEQSCTTQLATVRMHSVLTNSLITELVIAPTKCLSSTVCKVCDAAIPSLVQGLRVQWCYSKEAFIDSMHPEPA